MRKRLAVFLATSGHSGVDRIMETLLPSIASRGIKVDLLHIKNHGPCIEKTHPNIRIVELGSSHGYSSLPPLVRYLRSERPDTLLSDKDRVNQVALVAKWLSGTGTRTVVRYGQTVTRALQNRDIWQRTVHRLSMKYLYRYADAIITPSEGAARDLCGFARIPENRVTVVRNPVNVEAIRKLAEEPAHHPWFEYGNNEIITGLGELTSRKGFETMINAFSLLRRKRAAKLFLIGKGRGRERLEKLCVDLGLEGDVEFAGFKANPFPYLARADLFVQSSRYEGFGMALLEALVLGIPVVSTDCPSGPREVLHDGRFGRLVPVDDAAALACAMEETLISPPDPEQLVEAAAPHHINTVTDCYLDILGLSS
jgi:glycosyltransferase involved in cell wall biosynthesis